MIADINWIQFVNTLYPAALGAAIIKLLDLLVDRYRRGQSQREQKVDRLLEYINDFGELTELYLFFARYSTEVVTDESGELMKDENGNWMRKVELLEPDADLAEAFLAVKETDIRGFINQKIITIRLKRGECLDIADELDGGWSLRDKLGDLYSITVEPERILKGRDEIRPEFATNAIVEMSNAYKEANRFRGELRKEVSRYRK